MVNFIDLGLQLARDISQAAGPKLADFERLLNQDETFRQRVHDIHQQVEAFAASFPMPGYDYWVSYPRPSSAISIIPIAVSYPQSSISCLLFSWSLECTRVLQMAWAQIEMFQLYYTVLFSCLGN